MRETSVLHQVSWVLQILDTACELASLPHEPSLAGNDLLEVVVAPSLTGRGQTATSRSVTGPTTVTVKVHNEKFSRVSVEISPAMEA